MPTSLHSPPSPLFLPWKQNFFLSLSLRPRPSLTNDDHFLGSALEQNECLHFSQQLGGLWYFQGPEVCQEGKGELGLIEPELADPQRWIQDILEDLVYLLG